MRQTSVKHIALAVVLSTCASLSHAAVYKCANSKGQLVFQDNPCLRNGKAIPAVKSAYASFRTQLLIVESNADIERWVLTPSHNRKSDSARLRHVRRGQQLLIPAVVTDYAPDISGLIRLSADFQLVNPAGTVVLDAKKFSGSNTQDSRTPGLIVLNPVLYLTADPTDPLGSYTVRITVWDGARSAQAEESFELGE